MNINPFYILHNPLFNNEKQE